MYRAGGNGNEFPTFLDSGSDMTTSCADAEFCLTTSAILR
jgi:hypothetical protein